jgi:hypothetical protein
MTNELIQSIASALPDFGFVALRMYMPELVYGVLLAVVINVSYYSTIGRAKNVWRNKDGSRNDCILYFMFAAAIVFVMFS